jgi:hypothetical protein
VRLFLHGDRIAGGVFPDLITQEVVDRVPSISVGRGNPNNASVLGGLKCVRDPRLVVLKGGATIPIEALQLAWALEGRGATLAIDGNDLIVDGPRGLLTDDDRVAIRRWRQPLKAIASYCAPEVIE